MIKSEAIGRIQVQINLIEHLKNKERFSPDFKKWYRDTEIVIEKVFGQDTRHIKDFKNIHFRLGCYSDSTPDSAHTRAFVKGLVEVNSVLESFIHEIKEYGCSNLELQVNGNVSVMDTICRICSRFHLLVKQLRSRHEKRVTLNVEDEYDVQDLFHSILTLFFDDIRAEEWTPSYAGGSSRMDFFLKKEQTVIEIKKTRKGLGAKEVGEELLIDIQRYQAHPACKTLVCFVYDPDGKVTNPSGIENDLSKDHGKLNAQVIIAPKGF